MEKYFEDLKENLKKLVSIRSVKGATLKDAPFGAGVNDALSFTLSLAEKLGFETKNYDGYIGEVIFGEGEEFAILCHLDVVPEGKLSDWKYPPFSATEEDGKIYGRGTTDDKGPAIVCLYALKALKDEGFLPKRKIKLILGCDEESGWGCIDHYKKVAKMPDEGFSPDADFPVIYAEKGILHLKFLFENDKDIKYIKGGTATNMVADRCEADAPFIEKTAEKFGVKKEGEYLVALGKSAHGSTPEKGINAIEKLIRYLEEAGVLSDKIRRFLFEDELKLKELKDETGNLSLSPNKIATEDGKIAVTVDIRYPATMKKEEITEKLSEIGEYEILSHQPPLYNDKDGFLIKTLLRIYNEETGENASPIAIGGGTYARALKCGVAFGPETDEDFSIHQPNEFVSLKNLEMQFKIYKKAIRCITATYRSL